MNLKKGLYYKGTVANHTIHAVRTFAIQRMGKNEKNKFKKLKTEHFIFDYKYFIRLGTFRTEL